MLAFGQLGVARQSRPYEYFGANFLGCVGEQFALMAFLYEQWRC